MFFNGDDEDHDFMPSSGGSKLASLFGTDSNPQQGSNETLMYKAPTEPKKKSLPEPTSQKVSGPTPSVLTAVAVFAYKYVENKYVSQGKLGAAVIGSHASNDYKILLYITKEKPVSFTKITPSFSFVVQPDNYVSFYDDARQNWSLMFESEANLLQFSRQIAACKADSAVGGAARLDCLVLQDLTPGDGHPLEFGDSVELKSAVSLLDFSTGSIGTVVDSCGTTDKPLRLKVGKNKATKVWDEALIGMKRGGRRLMIVPASLSYEWEGKIAPKVSPGSTVVFDLEILRVKFSRDRSGDTVPSKSTESNAAEQSLDDEVTKPRSHSITDQSAAPSKPDKAKLISRMAKMGQSMLPQLPVNSDPADPNSSPVLTAPSPVSGQKPDIPSKPPTASNVHSHAAPVHHTVDPVSLQQHVFLPPSAAAASFTTHPYQPPAATQSLFNAGPVTMAGGQLAVYQPPQMYPPQVMQGYPPYSQPYGASVYQPQGLTMQPPVQQTAPAPASDPNLPMMLMETRQQNTEVRVSLSKITDKIDRMSEKMDQLHLHQSSALSLSSSMPSMEVSMLVHSIERIVAENERMKKELLEKSARVDGLNVKISELLQQNQMYVEHSNALLEQRNDSFKSSASHNQARLLQLEQEKVDLATRLSSCTSKLAENQLEITSLKKREGELKLHLDKLVESDSQLRSELGTLKVQLTECNVQAESTATQLRDESQQRKLHQAELKVANETVVELRNTVEVLEKNLAEKKRKSSEEISKLEAEMKELQSNYERELSSLKERLKLEKNTTEMSTAQQLTQIEDDLNRQWKEKFDRFQASLQDKHQRELSELGNEKQMIEEKLRLFEKKVQELKGVRDSSEQQLDALKDEIDELRGWKDKYDGLRAQAVSMKQRYESRISELVQEVTAAEQVRESLESKLNLAVDAGRKLKAQIAVSGSSLGGTVANQPPVVPDVQTEVKKVMNSVYRKLRSEFAVDSTYEGSEIHAVLLDVIKGVTLELMQPKEADADVSRSQLQKEKVETEDRLVDQKLVHSTVVETMAVHPESLPLEQPAAGVIESVGRISSAVETETESKDQLVTEPQAAEVEKLETDSNSEQTISGQLSADTEKELVLEDNDDELRSEPTTASKAGEVNSDEMASSTASLDSARDIESRAESLQLSHSDTTSVDATTSGDDVLKAEVLVEDKIHSTVYVESPRQQLDSATEANFHGVDDSQVTTEPDVNETDDQVLPPVSGVVSERDSDGKLSAEVQHETRAVSPSDDDEDANIFADARSTESGDGNAEESSTKDCRTGDDGAGNAARVPTISSEPADISEPPAIPPANIKAKTSIFDDDDDDDELFSAIPTKFTPQQKRTPTTTSADQQKRQATNDSDEDRKPPPLFDDSDDDASWMK